MRGIKNLVWISVVAMLVMALGVGVGTSSPGDVYTYVEPAISYAEPGETFTVHVMVGEWNPEVPEMERFAAVEDLFLADIWIAYDPTWMEVLDDTTTEDIEGIEPSDQPNSFEMVFREELVTLSPDRIEIRVLAGRTPGIKEGLDGKVGLFKITFVANEWTMDPWTGLPIFPNMALYVTDLRNSVNEHIANYKVDGYLRNVQPYPILWIKGKGAKGQGVYSDWRGADWFDGLTNTLNAKISNTGDKDANVRVIFTVTDPEGTKTMLLSNLGVAPAGGSVIVSATYDVPNIDGKYTFAGTVKWEVDPIGIFPFPVWEHWDPHYEDGFGGEGTSQDVPGLGTGAFSVSL